MKKNNSWDCDRYPLFIPYKSKCSGKIGREALKQR